MERAIANYRIEKVIGQGGMGKVYLGSIAGKSDQKVAIKELNPGQSSEAGLRLRFQREAEAMAKLNHPGIVRFLDFKYVNGIFYLIMEYVHGQTLSEYVGSTTGPIPSQKAVNLMIKILDAFYYAHQQGIIHRDIKPNNIIISSDGEVKILDFGIAKMDSPQRKLTRMGTVLGTPMYMSPEQIKGFTTDHRSDIYSLGVLLHYMVTGKLPYDDSAIPEYEIKKQVIQKPLPRTLTIYPGVPSWIQMVIDKATEKDMTLRYQNCCEFQNALRSQSPINNTKEGKNMRTIILGRDQSCDIIINDNSISRRHAEISLVKGKYLFHDISTNGSYLSGRNISGIREVIDPGTRVMLAGKIPLPWDQILALLPKGERQSNRVKGNRLQSAEYHSSLPGKSGTVECPKNYFTESVLVLVFCGLIFGGIALYHSNRVNTFFDRGDYQAALKSSENAKNWCIVGVVVAGFFILTGIIGNI